MFIILNILQFCLFYIEREIKRDQKNKKSVIKLATLYKGRRKDSKKKFY
jgi:hypothetical protein